MHRSLSAAGLALLLALAGCGGSDPGATVAGPGPDGPDRIRVVTSTDVYADIVDQIGGEDVEVHPIIDASTADPHSYEVTGRDELEVRDAALVVANGGGYDPFLFRLLDAADGSRPVLTAVDAAADYTAGGNEHVWYDLRAMSTLAARIADELTVIRPGSGRLFRARTLTFQQNLQKLMGSQAQIERAYGGASVALTEPLPLYLLQACGLVDRTPPEFSQAIEEGSDVPVRTLAQTLELFTARAVRLLVYNAQTTGPQTEKVRDAARAAGIGEIAVTETLPPGADYLGWMGENLDALRAGLA